MKRMVLVAMGLMLLAGSAFAQPFPGLPDTAYVGLFADVSHTVRQVNYGGVGFTPFTMYIFWLPSKMGIQGAEFKLAVPANVILAVTTKNPYITVELGTLANGISCAFSEDTCMIDWVESHHVTCYLTNATQTQVEVVENPTAGAYQVASCELGYPLYPVKRFTHLYMNWDGGIAVESKSWGSIKSLFQ